MNKTLGILAGKGELPIVIAQEARRKGYRVLAIGLEPLVDKKLSNYVDDFKPINVGKFGKIIDTLKKASVVEAIMGGKVPKTLLFKSNILPDLKAMSILLRIKNKSDDSILKSITDELKKEGINMLNITDFTSDMLTPGGVLTTIGLKDNEKRDIEFGLPIVRETGMLDIGQTVVIKDQAVMAVEAIEGTDSAILRGGEVGGEGSVVIKFSKPDQDLRFDFPVAGTDTIRSMIKVRARVLALESNKTIMLRKEEMIEMANKEGITIVGVNH